MKSLWHWLTDRRRKPQAFTASGPQPSRTAASIYGDRRPRRRNLPAVSHRQPAVAVASTSPGRGLVGMLPKVQPHGGLPSTRPHATAVDGRRSQGADGIG